MQSFILISVCLTFIYSCLFSADWHCVGGNYQKTFASTDQIIKPPLRLKWRQRVPGSMQSQPIIAEGKVFVRTIMAGHIVHAVDLNTGQILWIGQDPVGPGNYVKSWDATLSRNDGMCYYNGYIYYQVSSIGWGANPDYDYYAVCRNAETGEMVWNYKYDRLGSRGMRYSPMAWDNVAIFAGYGRESTPSYINFSTKGGMIALDATSGDLLWKIEKDPGTTVQVVGPTIDTIRGWVFGGINVDGTSNGHLFAVDIHTGVTKWVNQSYSNIGGHFISLFNDTLYLMNGDQISLFNAVNSAFLTSYTYETLYGYNELAIQDDILVMAGYKKPVRVLTHNNQIIGSDGSGITTAKCATFVLANGYVWRGGKPESGTGVPNPRLSAKCIDHMVGGGSCAGLDEWIHWGIGGCSSLAIADGKLVYHSELGGYLHCFEND